MNGIQADHSPVRSGTTANILQDLVKYKSAFENPDASSVCTRQNSAIFDTNMADLRGNNPGLVSFYRASAIVLVIFRTGHTIVGVLLQKVLDRSDGIQRPYMHMIRILVWVRPYNINLPILLDNRRKCPSGAVAPDVRHCNGVGCGASGEHDPDLDILLYYRRGSRGPLSSY